MKIKCNKCHQPKDESEFYFQIKEQNTRQPTCKKCSGLKYAQNHYKKNKDLYVKRAKVEMKKRKDWYREYKSKLKCELCPENHPAALDFHHKDPKKKEGLVLYILYNNGIKAALKEIKKCKVLCANCHRKEHYKLYTSVAQ